VKSEGKPDAICIVAFIAAKLLYFHRPNKKIEEKISPKISLFS